MAQITKPPVLDESYNRQQTSTNAFLGAIANHLSVLAKAQSGVIPEMDYNAIKAVVAAGNAPAVFPVGTQLVNTYTGKDGKAYDCPWDVVQPDDTAELASGSTFKALTMQMHYATLYDIPFSEYQAFYVVPEGGMAAGTYNVIMGFDWGNNVKKGTTYRFTLTKNAPAGARLTGFYNAPSEAPSSWKVYVYKDQNKSELLETCAVTSGKAGTNLGTFLANENGNLNSLYQAAQGDNRWYKSVCRQYLNSDAAAGSWWTPQDKWDMKPNQADTVPGFLSGFSNDFKNALTRVKVVTNGNNVTDDGSAVVTYDKVFLPSLQESYLQPQASGEGAYWPYWKERVGAKSPQALRATYSTRITYNLAQRTVGRVLFLRSARYNYGDYIFYIDSHGYVSSWSATRVHCCAPVCKMVGME